jgi:hypothetical protein
MRTGILSRRSQRLEPNRLGPPFPRPASGRLRACTTCRSATRTDSRDGRASLAPAPRRARKPHRRQRQSPPAPMPRTILACSRHAHSLLRPNSSSRLACSRSRHRRRNSSTSIGGKGGTSADGAPLARNVKHAPTPAPRRARWAWRRWLLPCSMSRCPRSAGSRQRSCTRPTRPDF